MKVPPWLKGYLHPRLYFSLGMTLMGTLLLLTGYPRYALTYFGLSILGILVVAGLKRIGL